MKNKKIKNKILNSKGMALPAVIIGLTLMTVFVAYFVKRSQVDIETKKQEGQQYQRSIEAEAVFNKIRHALNQAVSDSVNGIAISQECTTDDGAQATEEEAFYQPYSNNIKPSGGSEEGLGVQNCIKMHLTLVEDYAIAIAEHSSLNYETNCLKNCDSSKTYPKVFNLKVNYTNQQGEFFYVSGLVEVNPIRLITYSTLATAMSDPVVAFGPGAHQQVGLFWNMEVAEAQNFVPQISLFTSTGDLLTFTKIFTNVDPETAINYEHHQGKLKITKGVIRGTSPQGALHESFDQLKDDENTIRYQVGGEVRQVSAPENECKIRMGDCDSSSGNCYLHVQEGPAGGPLIDVYPLAQPTGSLVFYTKADTCRVSNITNINGGYVVSRYGKNFNLTFISDGTFVLDRSVKHLEGIPLEERGTLAFVSLSSNAVRLWGGAIDKRSEPIGLLARNGRGYSNLDENPEDPNFEIEAALLSTAGGAPIYLEDSIFDSNLTLAYPEKGLGILRTDGPQWAPELSKTVKYFSDGENEGNLAAGFSQRISEYGPQWAKNPPPGFELTVSLDHVSTLLTFKSSTVTPKTALSRIKKELCIDSSSPKCLPAVEEVVEDDKDK